MAGLGRKVFVANDVLAAADVNGFLMDQSVMVFDNAAARSSAIPAPTEGMLTYTKDDNLISFFDGASFVSVSNPGDITAVNAGTALTGGGESGDVTLDFNFAAALPFTSIADTAYEIDATDAGSYLRFTAAAGTITVGTATGFTAGQSVQILTEGTAIKIVPQGTAVQLFGRGTAQGTAGFIAESPFDAFSIISVGTNDYRIIGNVSAV